MYIAILMILYILYVQIFRCLHCYGFLIKPHYKFARMYMYYYYNGARRTGPGSL